mgnify:CR=1 FL=1
MAAARPRQVSSSVSPTGDTVTLKRTVNQVMLQLCTDFNFSGHCTV